MLKVVYRCMCDVKGGLQVCEMLKVAYGGGGEGGVGEGGY